MKAIFLGVLSLALLACGGESMGADAAADSATPDARMDGSRPDTATADTATADTATADTATDDTATSDTATDDTATSDTATGDAGDAAACTPTAVGRLCVRGSPGSVGENLRADAPVEFQIFPEGCHSSACTIQESAGCTVTSSSSGLAVEGSFCLRTEGMCTLPDCSGGGTASCHSASLPAGSYTATLGGLTVSFVVPSMLSFGGTCDSR